MANTAAKTKASAVVNERALERVKLRIQEKARTITPKRVSVGIHEADGAKPKLGYDHKDTGQSLVAVAAAHELKLNRSWLRSWFDRNRSRLVHEMIAVMRAEYKGDRGAIEKQGETWARELGEWIEYGDANLRGLEPSTVQRKKAAGLARPDTPLFATGELVAAIKSMMTEG